MDGKFKMFKKLDPLVFVFLAVGFGETVGQVLLIRELIINFQGNELSIGIILANWMFMIAVGSWGFGKITHKIQSRVPLFVITIIFFSLILPVQLLLARAINNFLGIGIGEVVGFFPIFYSSLLVVAPLCILNGFQFAFGCRILSEKAERKETAVGKVYVSEAIGCMAGGIIFTYLMVHYLQAFEIALYTVILNLIAAFFLLKPWVVYRKEKRNLLPRFLSILLIIAMSFCIYFISFGNIEKLHEVSRGWQWQGQKLICHKDSVYGNIAITQSNGQSNFYNNGLLMFSTPYPDISFIEEIVHFPLLYHPSPQKILLIGGGVGGVIEQILKHPVSKLDYIELDPLIVKTARKFLNNSTLIDPRIKISYTDGRFFIKFSEEKYDVVIINLPPPSTLQLNRFYTKEFFNEVYDILNARGILSFTIPASETYMSQEMLRHNRSIYKTIKEVFPAVLIIPGEWNLFLASSNSEISEFDQEVIYTRFRQRNLDTDLLTIPYIEYKLSPERIRSLLALYQDNELVKTNKDIQPIGTYYNLALWNVMFYPKLRGFFNWASKMRFWWFAIPISLMIIIPLLIKRRRRQQKSLKIGYWPIILTITTTGFAGMTISVLILFAYQILFGYLYQKIGILIAAFMLGIALGGLVMNKIMNRLKRDVIALINIEVTISVYSILIPFLLILFFTKIGNLQTFLLSEAPFSLLNCLTGFLVGLEFPLANKIILENDGDVGLVAGTLYGSDLVGGVFGALLTGIFLIPVLGILNTCFLVTLLKIASLILIINMLVLRLKSS